MCISLLFYVVILIVVWLTSVIENIPQGGNRYPTWNHVFYAWKRFSFDFMGSTSPLALDSDDGVVPILYAVIFSQTLTIATP